MRWEKAGTLKDGVGVYAAMTSVVKLCFKTHAGDNVVRAARGSGWGRYDSSPKRTGSLRLRVHPHLRAIEKARRYGRLIVPLPSCYDLCQMCAYAGPQFTLP